MDRLLDEIPELENRLLLYAAGELTADSAEAVEQELSENPSAGAALEEIRGLLGQTQSSLRTWDAEDPPAARMLRRPSDRALRAVFD